MVPHTAAVFGISTNFCSEWEYIWPWGVAISSINEHGTGNRCLPGILDGYVRDELRRVADNDVKVEVRIAGRVLLVGWACGIPIAHAGFCHGISFGHFVFEGEGSV